MILESERLYLRSLELTDAKRMSEYRNKPEVAQYQSWQHYTIQEAYRRIQHCLTIHSWNIPRSDYHLAIILKDKNIMIGDIFVEVVNVKTFVMGYTLDSLYWFKGYATEIISTFLEYMKNTYGFKKVVCYVYSDNIRSKKLLKKLCFTKFEESYYYNDEGYIKRL